MFLKVPNVVHSSNNLFKLVVMIDNTHFDKQYKKDYYFLIMAFSLLIHQCMSILNCYRSLMNVIVCGA